MPDAGPGPNIYVPLATATWTVTGIAHEANGSWFLDSSSNVTPVSGPVDTVSFPYWTQTY